MWSRYSLLYIGIIILVQNLATSRVNLLQIVNGQRVDYVVFICCHRSPGTQENKLSGTPGHLGSESVNKMSLSFKTVTITILIISQILLLNHFQWTSINLNILWIVALSKCLLKRYNVFQKEHTWFDNMKLIQIF